jgi:hypothetical protein
MPTSKAKPGKPTKPDASAKEPPDHRNLRNIRDMMAGLDEAQAQDEIIKANKDSGLPSDADLFGDDDDWKPPPKPKRMAKPSRAAEPKAVAKAAPQAESPKKAAPKGNAAWKRARAPAPEPEPEPAPKKKAGPPSNKPRRLAGGGSLDDIFSAPSEGRVRMGRAKKKPTEE